MVKTFSVEVHIAINDYDDMIMLSFQLKTC